MEIDCGFDFRGDSKGKDPDRASPLLKSFHKTLWSKPLPSGKEFSLKDAPVGKYLIYEGELGVHYLSSDSIANSLSTRKDLSNIITEIEPELINESRSLNSTIGAFILFPGNRIAGKMTINGERGFNNLIADRFDLTLECIRLYYLNQENPIYSALKRNNLFFNLFLDFKGYVDFFLLNDLVSPDYENVNFFNHVPDMFTNSPIPKDKQSYLDYRQGSMDFTRKRNLRIQNWAKTGQ